jgi:cytochrome c oxidase assembly protein subunit 15
MMTEATENKARPKAVGRWLMVMAFLVFAMVIVGGATRLTESGLSIVEWKPVSGALPPMNAEDWQQEFTAYQQSPEYIKVNRGMSLSEFKAIFWWEWGHRLLGRFIGIAFLIPFLWFLAKRAIPQGYGPRIGLMFILGGAQGALGWWMVASGLVSEPAVSHYRLAAHLSLALLIFCLLFWTGLDLLKRAKPVAAQNIRRFGWVFLGVLALQIVFGAFVAGLDAGLAYNTWPLMDGHFIPPALFESDDILHDTLTVQFIHRHLAEFVAILALAWAFKVWRASQDLLTRRLAFLLLFVVIMQITLGIATLLSFVPVGLGTMHQAGAVVVLAFSLMLMHDLKGGGQLYAN